MNIKIALAGNPNCGKTTLFNALTGSNQYVGNWPGVTVEKKEGRMKKHSNIILTDLPGIYSLSPYTPEEVVARNYIIDENPDAILNIVDGTNLERNLYLTSQLAEVGIPVVIAINMMDIIARNGDKINTELLSQELGCPIVEISALKGTGLEEAVEAAVEAAKNKTAAKRQYFSGRVEHAIAHIEEAAIHTMPGEKQRWYAIKIFERDEKVLERLQLPAEIIEHIETDIVAVEKELDDDSDAIIINERYNRVEGLMKLCYKKRKRGISVSQRIDKIVTNRFFALPIFFAIMWFVYYLSIGSVGKLSVSFITETLFGEWITPAVTAFLEAQGVADWMISLISEGMISSMGSVLGFVPQMAILFLLLSLLEDCGYMSRVAFIMDKLFRKFGLSGKSFIPLLVATGCGVPGIMASRTIEQERDRRMTVMTTGFIPCGAKMPIVGMISGALFGGSPWIAVAAYFIGIAAVVLSGLILKKTKPFLGNVSPFVMELPAYHAPVAANIFRSTWDRAWSFVKRAGTVIVAAGIIVWIFNSVSFDGGVHYITEENGGASVLQLLGGAIAKLFVPLGFGKWQTAVATVLGLVAKEEVVGTFGTLSSMAGAEGDAGTYGVIAREFFGNNSLSGLSFMIFNLLCAPCFAAMGAIRKEMNDWKWTAGTLSYMTAFAYCAALVVYQLGSWFNGGGNIPGTVAAVIVIIFAVYLLLRKAPEKKRG